MRSSLLWIAALFVGLTVAWAGDPGQRRGATDKGRADELIKKLSSDKFADRERASGELEKLGLDALDALKKAVAAKDTDQETRSRAEKLLAKLDQKLESATLLAPTKVRLDCKDMPVPDAVKQLSQKSGYSILLQGDVRKMAERKLTLDTGETTFWQAFDQLCEKAGLVQVMSPYGNMRFGGPPLDGIRIQPIPLPAAPVPGKVAPVPVQKNNPAAQEIQAVQALAQARAEAIQALRNQVQAMVADKRAVALPGQLRPVQVPQPPPPPPVVGGGFQLPQPGFPNQVGQFAVIDGKVVHHPTHYAGAVRFRIVPYDRNSMSGFREKSQGETLLILEVCAEPKLTNFHVEGSARVDKADDDQGQALTAVLDPMPNVAAPAAVPVAPGGRRILRQSIDFASATGSNRVLVPVRLKLGEKQAKSLKELAGSVTVECLSTPQALLTIDDVLKSAGKTVKGKDGGSMEVVEINKNASGEVRLKVRLVSVFDGGPGAIMPGGIGRVRAIQIGIGQPGNIANATGMPALEDAKGKAYHLTQIPSRSMNGNGNVFTQEMTLVYRPTDGMGEPARLVIRGQRTAHVQVPYRFTNVPLP
jgi:hypothetical protein